MEEFASSPSSSSSIDARSVSDELDDDEDDEGKDVDNTFCNGQVSYWKTLSRAVFHR